MADMVAYFGSFGYALIFFVIALSVIVAVHEYGHYIVGRWCGIHAEVFSLGFGPVLASRVDKHGTKWQIAAIPFGGFVKFLGDANAASVGSSGEVSDADRRRTMLGAPLWARAATVAAGPVFNFILSILIFAAVIMFQGRAVDPVRVAELDTLPPSFTVDIQPGDQLLAMNGIEIEGYETLGEVLSQAPDTQTVEYTVLRDGVEQVVAGPFPSPPVVQGLTPGSAAYDAGFKVHDVLTAINGEPIFDFGQIVDAVQTAQGAELDVRIWRDGEIVDLTLAPREIDDPQGDGSFEKVWRIGMSGRMFFSPETETPGLWHSVQLGTVQVGTIMQSSLSGLYHIIAGKISTCNLSGPVGIAQASGAMASQGIDSFIWFIAVISTAVGLMNLFPIPVLDGGHLVFHAYEAVTRRPPGENSLKILMAFGLAIILGATVFAILNDLLLCP